MQIVLDTNTLIRFFTDDDSVKAEKVQQLIEHEKRIIIPDVVFPELEYVLMGNYNVPRQKILDAYLFLLSQSNIKVSPYVRNAVEIFGKTNLDMADSIIAAQSQKGVLASFDTELLNVEKIIPFWKK